MKIASWEKESSTDYEGKNSIVVFTPKCSFNCGYCINPELKNYEGNLVDEKEIFNYINSNNKDIDALVISGGEPTNQQGLKRFAQKVKDKGLLVKLNTNGANFSFLQELRDEKLVDYLSVDIKGPIELYPLIARRKFVNIRDNIAKGIFVASQFPDYEFKTTLCPINEERREIRWMTPKEIGNAAELISNWSFRGKESKYSLIPFRAIEKDSEDKGFTKENIPEEFHETPKELLEECLIEARKHLPNSRIR